MKKSEHKMSFCKLAQEEMTTWDYPVDTYQLKQNLEEAMQKILGAFYLLA